METSEATSGTDFTGKDIFEVKFAIPRHETPRLTAALRHNTYVPKQFSRARIKTIYFDDRKGTSFYESYDGDIHKKKYRLRVYMDRDGGARYSMEIKRRDNRITNKVRELIYEDLPAGFRISCFHSLLRTFENITDLSLMGLRSRLPSKELLPSTEIFYDRIRFDDRYDTTRYNVDTSIRVMPGETARGKMGAGISLGHDIFEIKSCKPCIIPHFLQNMTLEPLSFSKFAWAKELLS